MPGVPTLLLLAWATVAVDKELRNGPEVRGTLTLGTFFYLHFTATLQWDDNLTRGKLRPTHDGGNGGQSFS